MTTGKKIAIYQIFTRLFGNDQAPAAVNGSIGENGCGKFNNFSARVLRSIKDLGVTHVWFTGVIAHASKTDYSQFGIPVSTASTVKGNAGSPYAIRDYFDVDPDLAVQVPERMNEFGRLIRRVHSAGLGFIMDFVPNHLAREYASMRGENFGSSDDRSAAFSPQNNFYYLPGQRLSGEIDWGEYKEEPARATGNDCFSACPGVCDWYETVKLNYGVDYLNGGRKCFDPIPDTWNKMLSVLLFWAARGVDGFRCDMAEMVPVEFWHWAIAAVKAKYPDVLFIAEIYNPGAYASYTEYGGFDYLYDKVGLYDTLRGVTVGRESALAISRCWQNLGTLGPKMLHFMENHDEQRIASDFFAGSGERGKAAMAVSALMDCCPVMVYAGQELGERGMDAEGFSGLDGRTTIFDYWSPDTLRRWYNNGKPSLNSLSDSERDLRDFYAGLLNIAVSEPAVARGKFFDLMYVNPFTERFNPHKQYAFLRGEGSELMLVVANFDDNAFAGSVCVPLHAFDYMSIKPLSGVSVRNMLTGQQQVVSLQPDGFIPVTTPAHSASLLKFIF